MPRMRRKKAKNTDPVKNHMANALVGQPAAEPPSNIENRLRALAQGLLFPSETDAPIELVDATALAAAPDPSTLAAFVGRLDAEPVETVNLESLFEPVMAVQDWYGDEELKTAARFKELYETIRTELRDVQVYRIGTRSIDVLIVGTAGLSRIVLRTKLVET